MLHIYIKYPDLKLCFSGLVRAVVEMGHTLLRSGNHGFQKKHIMSIFLDMHYDIQENDKMKSGMIRLKTIYIHCFSLKENSYGRAACFIKLKPFTSLILLVAWDGVFKGIQPLTYALEGSSENTVKKRSLPIFEVISYMAWSPQ